MFRRVGVTTGSGAGVFIGIYCLRFDLYGQGNPSDSIVRVNVKFALFLKFVSHFRLCISCICIALEFMFQTGNSGFVSPK